MRKLLQCGAHRSACAALLLCAATALACSGTARAQYVSTPPPRGFPAGPPAKILTFTAEPSSIQPGQSVKLTWAVVNADRIEVEPEIGVVATRDSCTVTPAKSIVYTLKAIGRGGTDKKTLTVIVAGTGPPVAPADSDADPLAKKPVPRAADGHPDLAGIYIGGFDIRPTGPIVPKPGAEKYKVFMDVGGSDLGEHCLPTGVPNATGTPYPLQIIQTPGQVVILYEADHLFRVIPTDGRPHPSDMDPTWMGNSVGHWEGDTLVVDVAGFNDKTYIGGYRHTTAYHVVERYTRTAYDKIAYEATIEDANIFAAPWKEAGTLRLHPEWEIQEYICEENNQNYNELFKPDKK